MNFFFLIEQFFRSFMEVLKKGFARFTQNFNQEAVSKIREEDIQTVLVEGPIANCGAEAIGTGGDMTSQTDFDRFSCRLIQKGSVYCSCSKTVSSS